MKIIGQPHSKSYKKKLNFHWKTFGIFCSRPTPLIGESKKTFKAPAFMDYTQQGFCDLKENSEKIVSPIISRRTCKIICSPNNCGAKSEPPFWISHFLKSFDVFVCDHHSFQLLRCMEKTNKQTKTTKQNKINKNKTKQNTKQKPFCCIGNWFTKS